ncbi:MAG: GspH/FimT family pseudopilin [Ralstonia sp.]|uniref:GspH/FimT family pseudopilin n=1 Tax=Ralstonia sp. TaxID=54061 RepID=UPI003F7DBDAC
MLAINSSKRRVEQAGVTLAELTIVIAIVGILVTAAVPPIVDHWRRETVILLADRLASALSLAQKTAQHRRARTLLAPRDASRGWASGWRLLEFPQGARADSLSDGRTLLSEPLPTAPIVQLNSNRPADALSYEPMGYSRISGATVTISSGRHRRNVVISAAGRARVCTPNSNGDC